MQDHNARDEAIDAEVAGLAVATASAVQLAINQAVRQIEVTAVQLLSDDIDRDVLTEAAPFTDAPVSAVIDVEREEILGISIDVGDVDVTLDMALAALPELRGALDGRTAVGHLRLEGDEAFASIAVPFRATDGSARIYATGFSLPESAIASALDSELDGITYSLLDRADNVLVTGRSTPATAAADPDRTHSIQIAGAPWRLRADATTALLEPTAVAWANSMALQLALVIVGMAGVTWLWTRSVQRSEALERSYERLTRVARHQREATAILAHELRTPITRALGMSTVLAGKRDQLTEQQRRDLTERMHRAAESLARIVDDLQVVVTSSGAMLSGEAVPVPVSRLVSSARDRVDSTAHVDLAGVPGDLHVLVDEPMAHRLLLSILDNAVKHGGGRVEVGATADGGRVDIVVRDHGPGVDPDFEDDLFEPFTQSHEHLRRDRGGLGVGLAVAQNLARGLGGSIRHEPATPGARFVVSLPDGGRAPNGEA